MNKIENEMNARGMRRWLRAAVPLVLAGFLVLPAVFAQAIEGRTDQFLTTPNGAPGPDSDSVAGGDDETVGTLPTVLGERGLDLRRRLAITRPSLCLQGNVWEVMNSIVAIRGSHAAQVTLLDAASGWVRIVVPGDTAIAFDRMALENGGVQMGVYLPDLASVNAGFTFQLGDRERFYAYPQPWIALPIVPLASAGTLDQVAFHASIGAARGATRVTARTTTDTLVVQQTH